MEARRQQETVRFRRPACGLPPPLLPGAGSIAADIQIRQATIEDIGTVADILLEAAEWLAQSGMPLWREGELEPDQIAADVAARLFFLAECSDDPAGTFKFQLEDPVFWPDMSHDNAAYVHRLAVRRRYSGRGLSAELLRWAADRTHALGRRFLRLDFEASRPRLREIYERFGFRHHSDAQVGAYLVSRYEYDVTLHASSVQSRASDVL